MDASSRLTLRIFISSPGDVPVERDRAADVIARLQEEFVHYACSSPSSGKTSPPGPRIHSSPSSPKRRGWTSSSASSGPGSALRSLWKSAGRTAALRVGTVYELETAAEAYQSRGLPTSSFTAGRATRPAARTTRPSGSAGCSSSRCSRHSSDGGSSTTTARSRRRSTRSRRPTSSSSSSKRTSQTDPREGRKAEQPGGPGKARSSFTAFPIRA